MFVIVHDNFVIKGPNDWNKLRFEEVIREDCEIEVTLDTRNDAHNPVIVSPDVKILPVLALPEPSYNPRTQMLNGPYWNFTEDNVAEMYYQPMDYGVETIKGFFMDKVTNARYRKEVSGVKKTIQGTEVTIDTARGSRDIFVQAYLTMSDTDTLNWKFPEGWLTLTKTELGEVVTTGRDHIQSCFDWENNWLSRSNAATTPSEMNTLYDELETELGN